MSWLQWAAWRKTWQCGGGGGLFPQTYDLRNIAAWPTGFGVGENDEEWDESSVGLAYGPDPGIAWGPVVFFSFMDGVEGHVFKIRSRWTYDYGIRYYFGAGGKYRIALYRTNCFIKRDGTVYNNQALTGPKKDNTWYDTEFRIAKDGAFEVRWAESPTVFGVTLPTVAQWTWTDPDQLDLACVTGLVSVAYGKGAIGDSGDYATVSDMAFTEIS